MWEEFANWVEVYRKPFVQEVTLVKYEGTTNKIKDFFGQKKSDEIKRIDLQKFFNNISLLYSERTNKNIYLNLKSFYQSMVDDGDIDRNPMNGIRYSGIEVNNKKKYLESTDVESIIKKLDLKNNIDLMIYISLKTGMRFAEVLGITKDDVYVDGENLFISVNKTLDYKYTKGFKTTKTTTSMREISIDKKLYETLVAYCNLNNIKSETSIFGVIYTSTVNRKLEIMCNESNIEPISFHGLRHTHGSLLLMKGVPIISVSKRLGHASLSITQDVYIHLMEEQEQKDNSKIVELMEGI